MAADILGNPSGTVYPLINNTAPLPLVADPVKDSLNNPVGTLYDGDEINEVIPGSGFSSQFFTVDNSNVAGLLNAVELGLYTPGTLVSTTYSAVTDGQNLVSFITAQGQPGVTLLPQGQILVHINAKASVAGVAQIYARISKYSVGGVETVLASTKLAPLLHTDMLPFDMVVDIKDTVLVSSDRMITRFYVVCPGVTPDIILNYDATTLSRTRIPAAGVDSSKFVTYTGVTQNVNLNSFSLTAAAVNATNVQNVALFKITGAAADPSTPAAGWFYYNTATNTLKFYNGTSWLTVATV